MKICIGLLSNRGFEQQMVLSLLKMIDFTDDVEFHFEVATEGYTIAENRNFLAAKSCQNNCTHLMMIDDDMIIPEFTLKLMLSHDKDMIGVNYNPRMLSDGYMVWKKGDKEGQRTKKEDLPNELYECEAIGFGAVLIKTKLFHEIERPWFDWEMYDTGMIKTGEDYYFCKKATKKGFKIWCDPHIKPVQHIGKWLY